MPKLPELFNDFLSGFVYYRLIQLWSVSVDCVGNSEIFVVIQTKGLKVHIILAVSVCPSVTV
jgi:hypothetical protein